MKSKRSKELTKRLPQVNWLQKPDFPHGPRVWESQDGMLRLILCDRHDDIPMSPRWILWKWKNGGWCRAEECRSRARIEKTARRLKQMMEETENDE